MNASDYIAIVKTVHANDVSAQVAAIFALIADGTITAADAAAAA